MLRWAIIALYFGVSVAAFGQAHTCTQQEAQRADEAVDTLKTWDRVYDWYKKYRQCDDGGPAEGVSEAIARNLVDRWETLPHLSELANDAAFRRFVIKHLNGTLNDGDLKRISANATNRCPAGLRPLCLELKKQADAQ